jgi:hypothetical protein
MNKNVEQSRLPGPSASSKARSGLSDSRTRSSDKGSAGKRAITQSEQIKTVLKAAGQSGLLGEKTSRISGRINPTLIKQAKKRTGIKTDTDLIEFALANVALEDNFAVNFKRIRGSVDQDLDLEF